MSTERSLYANEELREITGKRDQIEIADIRSSLMPSAKYSCSGSPLVLAKGKTANAGRFPKLGNAGRRDCALPSAPSSTRKMRTGRSMFLSCRSRSEEHTSELQS